MMPCVCIVGEQQQHEKVGMNSLSYGYRPVTNQSFWDLGGGNVEIRRVAHRLFEKRG